MKNVRFIARASAALAAVLLALALSSAFCSCGIYELLYDLDTDPYFGYEDDEAHTCTPIGGYDSDRCERFGHTLVEDDGVEPTCVKPGRTGRVYCSVCGKTITASETLPATGIHEEDMNDKCRFCGLNMNTDRETIHVRTKDNAAEITCTGRSKQHYDVVDLKTCYDFSYLRECGYDSVYVELSFNCKRLPTCYGPHVYLYSTVNCPTGAIDAAMYGDDCLFSTEVSGMFYTWGDKGYSTYISLDDLPEGRLYIRYGATSGIWKNRDVCLHVMPYRDGVSIPSGDHCGDWPA